MLYFRMVRDVRIEDEFGSPSDLVNLELLQMEDKICRVARFSFLLSGTKTSSDLWNMEIHLMSAQYSTNRGKVFLPNSE